MTQLTGIPDPPLSTDELLDYARAAKGFMPEDEGDLLFVVARDALEHGPGVEIGTWCGKSAVILGAAAREAGSVVFTVDHHRGSEENQPGWEWHDPTLVDPAVGRIDTLPFFRRTITGAGLEEEVIGIVGRAPTVARHWRTPWPSSSSTADTRTNTSRTTTRALPGGSVEAGSSSSTTSSSGPRMAGNHPGGSTAAR